MKFLIMSASDPSLLSSRLQADLTFAAANMIKGQQVKVVLNHGNLVGTLEKTEKPIVNEVFEGYQFTADLYLPNGPLKLGFLLNNTDLPTKGQLLDFFRKGEALSDGDPAFLFGYDDGELG